MTKRTRRNHSAAFKAKVALAVLKGDKTLVELVQQFDVHANQITEWKRQLLERAVTCLATPVQTRWKMQGNRMKPLDFRGPEAG